MLTATKARPALARTSSSIHASVANSRAASFLASSDIFDSPGRLIFDEDPSSKTPSSASRRYYPSHFRPLPDQTKTQIAASSAAPVTHTHKHLVDQTQAQAHGHGQTQGHAQARQISTLARHHAAFEGSAVMFDKPARPRHLLLVTSRHSHTRSASSSASLITSATASVKDHVPPPPLPDAIVYKNPARVPRKVPVQHQRSAEGSYSSSSSAVMGTVAALAGFGTAYELYGANQNAQSTPKNILSYSRSRENVA